MMKFGGAYLKDAEVLESDDVLAGHDFWVLTSEMPDEETAKKATEAILATKNVRSIFRGIVRKYNAGISAAVSSETT